MLKLIENPPTLHPCVDALRRIEGAWWVAHTKARSEKAFAWEMLERQVGYFLPMIQRVRFSGGRKRRVLLPLFASYVFICGDEQARLTALSSERICRLIAVADQQTLIEELSSIQRVLAGSAAFDPYPFAAVGRRCRVSSGPFQGIEGVVITRTAGTSSLVLQVSMLGCGAAMQIDPDLLEPVD